MPRPGYAVCSAIVSCPSQLTTLCCPLLTLCWTLLRCVPYQTSCPHLGRAPSTCGHCCWALGLSLAWAPHPVTHSPSMLPPWAPTSRWGLHCASVQRHLCVARQSRRDHLDSSQVFDAKHGWPVALCQAGVYRSWCYQPHPLKGTLSIPRLLSMCPGETMWAMCNGRNCIPSFGYAY